MEIRVKKQKCPYCGFEGDGVEEFNREDRKPKPGDISVCISCAGIQVFGEEMELLKISKERLTELKEKHPITWAEINSLRSAIKITTSLQRGMVNKP